MSYKAPIMTTVISPAVFMQGYLSDIIITIECGGLCPHRYIFHGFDVLEYHIKSIGVSSDDANYLCSYLEKSYLDMIRDCCKAGNMTDPRDGGDNLITLDDRCKEILTSCGLWPREGG